MGRAHGPGPWARPMGPKMAAWDPGPGPGPGPWPWARARTLALGQGQDPGPMGQGPAAIFGPMGLAHGPMGESIYLSICIHIYIYIYIHMYPYVSILYPYLYTIYLQIVTNVRNMLKWTFPMFV